MKIFADSTVLIAQQNGVFNLNILGKIPPFEAESYIKTRGELGNREKFMKVLDKVPD